jgi:hypothetical protein
MTRAALLWIVLVFVANASHAQTQALQDVIEIDGIVLKLGMAQGDVLNKLGDVFDLKEMTGAPGAWLAVERGKPMNARVSVTFNKGKLMAIGKYWTVDEPSTEAAFAEALYGVLSNFQAEGRTACALRTASLQNPTNKSKGIYITCGRKTLDVLIVQDQQGRESASITEALGPN